MFCWQAGEGRAATKWLSRREDEDQKTLRNKLPQPYLSFVHPPSLSFESTGSIIYWASEAEKGRSDQQARALFVCK